MERKGKMERKCMIDTEGRLADILGLFSAEEIHSCDIYFTVVDGRPELTVYEFEREEDRA